MKKLCILAVLAMLTLTSTDFRVMAVNQLQRSYLYAAGDEDPPPVPIPAPLPPDHTHG